MLSYEEAFELSDFMKFAREANEFYYIIHNKIMEERHRHKELSDVMVLYHDRDNDFLESPYEVTFTYYRETNILTFVKTVKGEERIIEDKIHLLPSSIYDILCFGYLKRKDYKYHNDNKYHIEDLDIHFRKMISYLTQINRF